MKRSIFITAALFFYSASIFAQSKDYKVVFDVTTKDTNVHKAIIRWCNEIMNANPDAKLEVVYYGQSLEMVTQGKSVTANDLTKLATQKKVTFTVCQQAMKRWNIESSQLLPGVVSVPDGIYEILLRQREGFIYIKASL